MIPISEKLATEVNAQISRELGNSILYAHFASWAHVRGLKNIAKFFKGESDGEKGHAEILTKVLDESNIQIAIPAIPQKPADFADCMAIAEEYERAEVETTDHLDELYQAAESEKCIGLSNVLQSLLEEQLEEQGTTERVKSLFEQAGGNYLLLDLMFD